MTKASDNAFPSVLITEGTEPSAPAAGKQRLYIDSTSHHLSLTNSSGTERDLETGVATFVGAKVYNSTTESFTTGQSRGPLLNTDELDTDNYHFTSAANLTGTVSKTATSADIVGSSTSFTTELTVNQIISIPGTAAEIGVVKIITDNTHLTLWQTMANTASGQTAARVNNMLAVPASRAGKYRLDFSTSFDAYGGTAVSNFTWRLNGATARITDHANQGVLGSKRCNTGIFDLASGDYFQPIVNNGSSGTVNVGHATNPNAQSVLILEYLGA